MIDILLPCFARSGAERFDFVCDRQMMKDPETIPLLLSLCKLDYSSQMTAVKVLAELAEEPLNRVPLVSTTSEIDRSESPCIFVDCAEFELPSTEPKDELSNIQVVNVERRCILGGRGDAADALRVHPQRRR